MELSEILAACDHTLLAQTATWADIRAICDDGMKYHTASVCIPASFVKQAKEYVGDKLPLDSGGGNQSRGADHPRHRRVHRALR